MDGEVSVSVTKGTRTRTGTESEIGKIRADPGIMPSAVAIAGGQFLLGAWLWVAGQQVGSLACTGLGYWVVFDAFGVALGHILPGYLARPSKRAEVRRPFGNARIETVMTFAQTVYLIFTSVYVCKETVEHLLLSSGEGHHHHHGDEVTSVYGIDFPISLLVLTLFSLLITAIPFDNHAKLVSTAGNHIPPLTTLLPSRSRYHASSYAYPTRLSNLLSNPYTLSPILFSASIICTSVFVSPRQHRPIDLILAAVETVITFSLAYPAAVALGAVLLQTSPARGLAGGRMEAFLRAMREIERHPQVLHPPRAHLAAHAEPRVLRCRAHVPSLVVTLELHVRQDLENDEVLRLTRWAWERCVHALHFGTRGGEGGEGEAEVTVGIVRG
ncbi:Zinc transporter 6 [Grifola frondosa]|uniref:Zinc transporter 6 n=1 Tax=Grifola frondosa TaxID=5627 RepID=A0A1C7MIM0_GRIFR|nr:Zinc transporter 6 [Grifola frondosa]